MGSEIPKKFDCHSELGFLTDLVNRSPAAEGKYEVGVPIRTYSPLVAFGERISKGSNERI